MRLKFGGGLGGHNGLKDITAHLGTQDYWRLRIGIGHPGDRNEVVNYVLKPPRKEERGEIDARSIVRCSPGRHWRAAISARATQKINPQAASRPTKENP